MALAADLWDWALFWTIVGAMLMLDLVASRRQGHSGLRVAAVWSGVWISIELLFGLWLTAMYGADAGMTYLVAYTLEKSLSIDNLFVFVLIFGQLHVPPALQHRVLFWGIMGALIMRAVMIALGIYLLEQFHWVIYPFAFLLVFAAMRLLVSKDKEREQVRKRCTICSTWVARFIPVTGTLHGQRFFVHQGRHVVATPLLIALVVIETTDLIFALDSIPAVLGVTRNTFLVYTSNVFAMLGLRSLYFVLNGVMDRFRYLKTGLALILWFVAGKMLLESWIHVPAITSLSIVVGIVLISILASHLSPQSRKAAS
jgi:tellurite resistance protein TerC